MRRIAQIVVAMLLLTMGAIKSYAQPATTGKAKSLVGIEVHFRFDQSVLDLNYMGNKQSLERFAHVIDSLNIHNIDSVVIVSQSSPEGAYLHNIKLSRERAATMREAIEQRHPELGSRLHVHPDGESWMQLREYVKNDELMKQSTIDQVLSIIDDTTISIDTKKWRLEHLPIYRYLRMTYFPLIRNSVFCIVYYEKAAEVTPIEKPEEEKEVEADEVVEVVPTPTPEPEPEQTPDEKADEEPTPEAQSESTPREPMMSVRTNMLYDLGSALNVGIEYYLRDSRWSILADYTFPWWSHDASHRYLQMLNGSLEARRYFKNDNTHTGHYLSAYGHANLYDFSFDAERAWQGEGWGLGLGYGYVWQPWKNERWKLEAFVRFGYYHSLYDPYHASDPYIGKYYYDWDGPIENFIRRNHRLRWLGPTGAGVTISYDLFKRKVKSEE